MKTMKRALSILIIMCMIITNSDTYNFVYANNSVEQETSESMSVEEETIEKIDEEVATEEETTDEEIESIEEKNKEIDENETTSNEHEETETSTEEFYDAIEDTNTTDEATEEIDVEKTEEVNVDLYDVDTASSSETEVEEEQAIGVKDKLFGATFRLKFVTDSSYGGKAYVINNDIQIEGETSFRNKNVGDPITAPTVTISNSVESSKGLSFAYWYHLGFGHTINSGANYTLTDNDSSGYNFVTWFTDNRKSLTLAPHSSDISNININNPSGSETNGWVISDNKAIRKSRITQDWLNDIINNLGFSAGYGYDKIVNSSGAEVDPLSWDRNSNVTYYIKAKMVGTSVSFNLQGHGSPIDSQVVNTGDKVIKPADPTDTNFTFAGWYKESTCENEWNFDTETIQAGQTSVTIYAKWEEKYNIVNFHMGTGESISVANPYTRYYTQTFTLPTPTKTGYEFVGWYDNSGLTGTSITSISNNTNATIDLYPKWNEKSYNVSFNLDGGTLPGGVSNPTSRKYTDSYNLPTPTKTGYTFKKWHKDSASGEEISSIAANTASAVTVYAEWGENTYKVNWYLNGGTIDNSYTKVDDRLYTQSITLPTSTQITKEFYDFEGWYDNNNFTGSPITTLAGSYDGEYYVFAKWDGEQYNITYDLDGGSFVGGYVAQTVHDYNTTVDLPPSDKVEKIGWTFKGWYDNPSFTGNAITTIPASITTDSNIYAKWEVNRYSITYVENGGTYVGGYTPIRSRAYTDYITLPDYSNIVKEYFNFRGWYDNDSFAGSSVANIPASSLVGDKTFYANWEMDSAYAGTTVYLRFDSNGGNGTMADIPYTFYDEASVPVNEFSKAGYTFSNWVDENGAVVSSNFRMVRDVTLKAIWTQNYVPSWTGGGGSSSGGSSGGGGGGRSSDVKVGPLGDLTSIISRAKFVKNKDYYRYVNTGAKQWIKNQDGTYGLMLMSPNVKIVGLWIEDVVKLANGSTTVDVYYFDDAGKMVTGIVKDDKGDYYYFEAEPNENQGKMVVGYKIIDGDFYYFEPDGKMLRNGTTPEGFRVDANGKLILS